LSRVRRDFVLLPTMQRAAAPATQPKTEVASEMSSGGRDELSICLGVAAAAAE